eukprot:jgi/Ulvmu1/11363/UM075_0023.1
MDEQKADQLWRELTDTDRAAKRGHGIGFGTESTAADQHERSNAPAGLASTFRKATDIESKEMAQEKLSARDRIRARVKEAMQNKTASQHREDSQWENFLTQKKRERVGLDSIVDEHGRMLGCTYNYEDTDNTDLDNAIAKAAAVRASDSVDREDRNARRGGGAVLRHEPSRDGRRDEGRRGAQRAEADGGRGAHGVRQQRAGLETDSRAPEREGAHDAADAWGPRSGMVVRSPTDGGERRALDAGGRDVHAVYSGALGAGAGEGGVSVSAGLGVAEGVVPEGAVVVAECELNREAPEVEAHDALDTSVVIKARGSWREQLKRRMEGVL